MRTSFLPIGIVVAAFGTGCGGEPGSPATGGERAMVDTEWDLHWTVGGTVNDTLLFQPWRVAADDRTVYVLDKSGARVVAFSAATGTLRWIAGRPGSGPGEYQLPTALTVADDGTLWVGDSRNARITRLSPEGETVDQIPLDEVAYVDDLCPLGDGTVLAMVSGLDASLVRLDEEGVIRAEYDLPWPDLRDAPALTVQSALTADGGRCALALTTGRGLAVFDPGIGFRDTVPYIEQVPEPEVETMVSADGRRRSVRMLEPIGAARGAVLHDDTVTVAFGGSTEHAGRVLDRYSATTGRYLSSVLLPWGVPHRGMAYRDGTWYFLSSRRGAPVLIAARPGPE